MNFATTVEGVNDLIDRFEKVRRGVVDLRQLGTWDWAISTFQKVQKSIFDSEGAAAGSRWKALTPAYAAVKARRYGSQPILQATGKMYREFTSAPGLVDKKEMELTLGFSQPAGYHMGKGARSKMPYRSSLDMTDAQLDEIQQPIVKKLKQLIDNAKLRDIRGF